MIKTSRGKWFSIPHYGSCEAINAALPAKERLAAEKPQLRPRIWYFVSKIVLTYSEKKSFSDREKLMKFRAEGREFAKSLEQFVQKNNVF